MRRPCRIKCRVSSGGSVLVVVKVFVYTLMSLVSWEEIVNPSCSRAMMCPEGGVKASTSVAIAFPRCSSEYRGLPIEFGLCRDRFPHGIGETLKQIAQPFLLGLVLQCSFQQMSKSILYSLGKYWGL